LSVAEERGTVLLIIRKEGKEDKGRGKGQRTREMERNYEEETCTLRLVDVHPKKTRSQEKKEILLGRERLTLTSESTWESYQEGDCSEKNFPYGTC